MRWSRFVRLNSTLKGVIRAWRENDGQCGPAAEHLLVNQRTMGQFDLLPIQANPCLIALQSCFIEDAKDLEGERLEWPEWL